MTTPLASLAPRGPFDLATAATFLCGFTPAAGGSALDPETGALTLGFLRDGSFRPTVVRVRARGTSVEIERDGDAPDEVAAQVARILSLDHDAEGLASVAAADPVIGALLGRRPGFRPVVFPSPYEAAVWGVLAQRVSMRVAAALRRRLSVAARASTTGFGQTFFPAPPPRALLEIEAFPGIPAEKLERLHAVARAALDGALDAEDLRALPEADALARLRTLRGVGEWTSKHVLYRGCGVRDALPDVEPRVLRAVGEVYGLGRTASVAELAARAERWRPYRMWISILLVWCLRGSPRWHGPERRGASRRATPA